MNPAETLEVVLSALEDAGVEYMLTGSVAGSYHGVPRTTQDIDLVVDGSEEDLLAFARRMSQQGFYVSEDAVREAAIADGGTKNIGPDRRDDLLDSSTDPPGRGLRSLAPVH